MELKNLVKPSRSVFVASYDTNVDKRLAHLSQRAYSSQWDIPEDVNEKVVDELKKSVCRQGVSSGTAPFNLGHRQLESFLRGRLVDWLSISCRFMLLKLQKCSVACFRDIIHFRIVLFHSLQMDEVDRSQISTGDWTIFEKSILCKLRYVVDHLFVLSV